MKARFFATRVAQYIFGVRSPLSFRQGERRGHKQHACITLFMVVVLTTGLSVYAQENPEPARRAMPVSAGPNDMARFLAGMPVPENSPLAPLMRDPAWQEHAAFFERE